MSVVGFSPAEWVVEQPGDYETELRIVSTIPAEQGEDHRDTQTREKTTNLVDQVCWCE